MRLYRYKVQSVASLRVLPPRLPGGQKAGPQSKAGFTNRKLGSPPPPFRQAITLQKHPPRLPQRAIGRMIRVLIDRADGYALLVERKDGGHQGLKRRGSH